MSLSMHNTCTPALNRGATAMLTWLDKAEEHAKNKGF